MDTDAIQLRRQNDELRDELAKAKADKEFVWSLWKKLQVASPDVSQAVSLVVQREKEKAEAKDQKVLQILHAKDARLMELEAQNSRLSSELSGLMKQKADLLERVERLDAEVVGLHDKNRHLLSQLKLAERGTQSQDTLARDALARSESEAARLRAQVGQLQSEAADLRDQTASARMAARAAQDDARAARAEAAVDKERRAQLEGQAGLLQQVQALQEGTQAMLEAQSDELTSLRAELQRWRDACAELEVRLQSRGPPHSTASSANAVTSAAAATAAVPDYPYKVAQLEAKIASLRARLRRPASTPVPQAMVELQSRLNAATKRALAAEAEGRVKHAEAERLRAAVQKKSSRAAALKAALRLAKEDAEERLNAERLLEDNAKLQNELALAQVQLAEQSATTQQLRKSLDYERRTNDELRDAVSAAAAAEPRAEDIRVLTDELECARRKVLQLRDLIGRQTRDLEAHAGARRDAESRAETARAELTRKNQVLIEMKRYLRHLGRRVTGLRAAGAGAAAVSRGASAKVEGHLDPLEDSCWEDLPDADMGEGDELDVDATVAPASGRSLGQEIAAASAATRPLFVARLQARAGALQQQLLQCRRARQKASAERDQAAEAAERLRLELAQSQARCRRLKEACDKAQRQQQQLAGKDPGYHSEGQTGDDCLVGDVLGDVDSVDRRGGQQQQALSDLSEQLARCRLAKSRAEREAHAARDAVEELRRRLRSAEETAATERAAAEKARVKSGTLKETIRRSQSQLETSRAAAASAGEQRRRFEQLWQEARAELDQVRQRLRQSAADGDRRRRLADEATARSQGAVETARDQLAGCQARLAVAERLLGQLGRQLESKVDAARMLVSAHCDRAAVEPQTPAPPPPPPPSDASAGQQHQRKARELAAGILNLSQRELDAILAGPEDAVDAPHHRQYAPQQQQRLRRLAELRASLGSREADKLWANQCLRLAQATLASSSTAEADQLLDKFSEKFDEILNTIRLLAT